MSTVFSLYKGLPYILNVTCGEGRNTSSPKNACVGGYADARRCSYFELGLPVVIVVTFDVCLVDN